MQLQNLLMFNGMDFGMDTKCDTLTMEKREKDAHDVEFAVAAELMWLPD